MDPLATYNPIIETEHYIDGQHNRGVLNSFNLNVYGYCYQNPVRLVDPNGKQVDAIKNGVASGANVINDITASVSRKKMGSINGIVLHRTVSSNASSAINTAKNNKGKTRFHLAIVSPTLLLGKGFFCEPKTQAKNARSLPTENVDYEKLQYYYSIIISHCSEKTTYSKRNSDGTRTPADTEADIYEIRADKNGTEIFEFVADNTDVEWSQIMTGKAENKGLNFLTTGHIEYTELGVVALFSGQLQHGYSIRKYSHNHPGGTEYPSGLIGTWRHRFRNENFRLIF